MMKDCDQHKPAWYSWRQNPCNLFLPRLCETVNFKRAKNLNSAWQCGSFFCASGRLLAAWKAWLQVLTKLKWANWTTNYNASLGLWYRNLEVATGLRLTRDTSCLGWEWRAASGTTGGGGWLHGAWTRAGRSHQLKAFATWGESIRRGLRDCSGRGRGWAPPLLWIMPCHLPYNWKQSLKTKVKVLSQSMLPDFRNRTAFFFFYGSPASPICPSGKNM
jgi:hypothetical protein